MEVKSTPVFLAKVNLSDDRTLVSDVEGVKTTCKRHHSLQLCQKHTGLFGLYVYTFI